jgi:hypothetical protein
VIMLRTTRRRRKPRLTSGSKVDDHHLTLSLIIPEVPEDPSLIRITIITDIATFEDGAKVAYFKDPDGNTPSIAQAPRS